MRGIRGQAVRPSQFITTYGIGSILETVEGPVIIGSFEHSGLLPDPENAGRPVFVPSPADYEIVERRMSISLLDGHRIFRLPTNDEVVGKQNDVLFSTTRFPTWSLCIKDKHYMIYRAARSGASASGCPKCPKGLDDAIYKKAHSEAITFVKACPAGHLDDVDWVRTLKHSPGCSPTALEWRGFGGSLKNIDIACPECGAKEKLGTIYGTERPCNGRFPEIHGWGAGDACTEMSRVFTRGAANLRLPELRSTLTVPPNDDPIHIILGSYKMKFALEMSGPITSKKEMESLLAKMGNRITHDEKTAILEAEEDNLLAALELNSNEGGEKTEHEMLVQEFEKLQQAATKQIRPVKSGHAHRPYLFEVDHSDSFIETPGRTHGRAFRITPVNRLRVVLAQVGYTRPLGAGPHTVVSRDYSDGAGDRWYPGVELSGEGIFIDHPPQHVLPPLTGAHADNWAKQYENWAPDDPPYQKHPLFVWWHTLAHRLITALSIDSGYAAASIRERVFIRIDDDGRAEGGLLLYTSQPGGDGTLGGLVSLGSSFPELINAALDDIAACSNDPICGEETFRVGKVNGAACYACQMVSETSCEHRNMSLDRNLLRTNPP